MEEEKSKQIIIKSAKVVHMVSCNADRYGKCTFVLVFMTPDHDTYVWRTGSAQAGVFTEGETYTIRCRLEEKNRITNVTQMKKPMMARPRLEDYKTEQQRKQEEFGGCRRSYLGYGNLLIYKLDF